MPVDEPLRRLVDQILLGGHYGNLEASTFKDVCQTVKNWAEAKGISFDSVLVLEYWWHLARTGMIALTGGHKEAINTSGVRYPNFLVTERGKTFLLQGENSPHDPQRYLAAIRKRVTSPDPIVITYIDEAVGAWSAGLNRASAVMLGGACERLVIMLAEVIATKGLPKSAGLAMKLANPNAGISGIFEDVRETLTNHPTLSRELKDRLDRKLSAIFDHARILRNKTGHPTGEVVTSEDAQAGLLLFPGFYELVVGILQAL